MGPSGKILDRPPGPLDFPSNFNPHAVNIWFAACSQLPTDIRSAWVQALHEYKAGCAEAGLIPFVDPSADTTTAIQNYLYEQRQKIARFLTKTQLTRGLKAIRNLNRSAALESYGFRIEIIGQYRISDPTWVQSLFKLPGGYRFSRMRTEHRYELALDPGLVFFAFNEGTLSPDRWHLGYRVLCPLVPLYDEGTDAEAWILDKLWRPLVNTYRARDLSPRHL